MHFRVSAFALLVVLPSLSGASAMRVVSPDGAQAVEIVDFGLGDANGTGAQALVLEDRKTGRQRQLLVSHYDEDYQRNLSGLSNPLFSLDGGYLYINSSDTAPGRSAVHQIELRTGKQRFVIGGYVISLMRTGPYRGFLLVQKHRYYNRPAGGSYNPVFVVRPDGQTALMIPGSATDNGETAIKPWLTIRGWRAW